MSHWLKDAPPWLVYGASVVTSVAATWIILMVVTSAIDREMDQLQSQIGRNTDKIMWHMTQQPHHSHQPLPQEAPIDDQDETSSD